MLERQVAKAYCTSLKARGYTQRTVQTNRERLRYLHDFLSEKGVCEIEKISPEVIDEYVSSMYQKKLSVFTIAGRIQVIKTFFDWSVRRKYIAESPASHLKMPRLNYKTSKKAIAQEDLEAMIETSIKDKKLLEEAMLTFLADTGCRSGELCSINIADLDFLNLEVYVEGKTGGRVLDFTEKTADVLRHYIRARNKEFGKKRQALFLFGENRRVTTDKVYVSFRNIARGLNIKRFNPHSIRHRVAQAWLDQGANLELVRMKLGHKDVQTTALYYAHQDRSRSKRATKRFSIVKDV